jgi:hypothetical protein
MGKVNEQSSGAAGAQVFELTMDNPEDLDELNRLLRKPGETDSTPLPKTSWTGQGESAPNSVAKKEGSGPGMPC